MAILRMLPYHDSFILQVIDALKIMAEVVLLLSGECHI